MVIVEKISLALSSIKNLKTVIISSEIMHPHRMLGLEDNSKFYMTKSKSGLVIF